MVFFIKGYLTCQRPTFYQLCHATNLYCIVGRGRGAWRWSSSCVFISISTFNTLSTSIYHFIVRSRLKNCDNLINICGRVPLDPHGNVEPLLVSGDELGGLQWG